MPEKKTEARVPLVKINEDEWEDWVEQAKDDPLVNKLIDLRPPFPPEDKEQNDK